MAISHRRLLYGPAYRTHGVAAAIVLTNGAVYDDLTARDFTSGVAVPGEVEIESVRPAAGFMAGDLIERGIALADLDGAVLTLTPPDKIQGGTATFWRVGSHRPMPSPNGIADGEVYLLLESISGD